MVLPQYQDALQKEHIKDLHAEAARRRLIDQAKQARRADSERRAAAPLLRAFREALAGLRVTGAGERLPRRIERQPDAAGC